MAIGYRAIQDFSNYSGADSFAVPSSADPTIDSSGEIAIDETTESIKFYDGTAERSLRPLKAVSFSFPSPDADADAAIVPIDVAGTLVKVNYLCVGGTNWVGQVQEFDANGGSGADVHSGDVTAVAGTVNSQTAFTNAAFDAGDYLGLKTTSVSGTPDRIIITCYYYENV